MTDHKENNIDDDELDLSIGGVAIGEYMKWKKEEVKKTSLIAKCALFISAASFLVSVFALLIKR